MSTSATEQVAVGLEAACARWDVSVRTLTRAIAAGDLVAYKSGPAKQSRVRIRIDDLDAFMQRNKIQPTQVG